MKGEVNGLFKISRNGICACSSNISPERTNTGLEIDVVAGVKDGRFPPSYKLGPRTTVWKVEDIRALFETIKPASLSPEKL